MSTVSYEIDPGDTSFHITTQQVITAVTSPAGATAPTISADNMRVTWHSAGVYTVKITVNITSSDGQSGHTPIVKSETVTESVTVVAVKRIDFKWGTTDWTDITTHPTNFVPINTIVNFRAIPDPADATWPGSKPVWTGATASGADASQTYPTPGVSTVSAECGNLVQGKMCAVKVDFNKDPVKIGIGENRSSETAAYPETTPATYPYRLMATITPKDASGTVIFDSSNAARATVVEVSRTDVGNTEQVILNATGVSETPVGSPGGDTDIRAVLNGTVCQSTKVVVIVPKTQIHGPFAGKTIMNESSVSVPLSQTYLHSVIRATTTITIKDQFGDGLDSIYNGEDIVQEKFVQTSETNITGTALSETWVPITDPNSDFIDGKKDDLCQFGDYYTLPQVLSDTNREAWVNGTYTVNGKNNVFSIKGAGNVPEAHGDQQIKVDGYSVTPDWHRVQNALPNNHPPVPFNINDTEIVP